MTQGKSQNHDVRKAGDVDVYVGGRIRALRNMQNITQDELGQKIGVSFQQVQKYEKGTNRCTPKRLVDIAEHLECSPAALLPAPKRNGQQRRPTEGAVAMEDIRSLARSSMGMRLVRAYLKLNTPKLRSAVAELAENLSQI